MKRSAIKITKIKMVQIEQVANGFIVSSGVEDAPVMQIASDLAAALAIVTALFTPPAAPETPAPVDPATPAA